MKRIYTLIALLLFAFVSKAQSPQQMNYQAVIRDANNQVTSNTNVATRISLLKGTVDGTAVYTEIHTGTTNANGLLTLNIGAGTTTDDFSSIDWSQGPYFIKTETDPTGGTDYSITATSQLMSVPYALHSKTAAALTGLSFYYGDRDGDGYGDKWNVVKSTTPVEGYVLNKTDCNDNDNTTNPDKVWYIDADGDGYGSSSEVSCERPANGFVLSSLSGTGTDDCDDSNIEINPGKTEIDGNGLDDDCDGIVDIPVIGQERDGGIVFYIAPVPTDLDGDGDLDTGLVCATENQSSEVLWRIGYIGGEAKPTAASVGSGSANTATIIAAHGEGSYAASMASVYNGGGFDDWFLPSKDELNLMYVNLKLNGIGGFTDVWYWSSVNSSYNNAWAQNFVSGNQAGVSKGSTIEVRAVRAF